MTNNKELTKGFKEETGLLVVEMSILRAPCCRASVGDGIMVTSPLQLRVMNPQQKPWRGHRVNGTHRSVTCIPSGSSFLRLYSLNKRENSQRLSAEWFKPALHTYPWWVLLSNCTWQSKLKEDWQGYVSKCVLTSASCRALWHVSRGSAGLHDRGTTLPQRPDLAGAHVHVEQVSRNVRHDLPDDWTG